MGRETRLPRSQNSDQSVRIHYGDGISVLLCVLLPSRVTAYCEMRYYARRNTRRVTRRFWHNAETLPLQRFRLKLKDWIRPIKTFDYKGWNAECCLKCACTPLVCCTGYFLSFYSSKDRDDIDAAVQVTLLKSVKVLCFLVMFVVLLPITLGFTFYGLCSVFIENFANKRDYPCYCCISFVVYSLAFILYCIILVAICGNTSSSFTAITCAWWEFVAEIACDGC